MLHLLAMVGEIAEFRGVVVRQEPTHSAIADAIRRELLLGRVIAGQRMPRPAELAATLRQETSDVLDAFIELTRLGFLVEQDDGFVLHEPDHDKEFLRDRMRADERGVVHFTEYRAILESGAAGYAALRRSDEDLAAMEMAQQDLLSAGTTVEARNADTAFHLAVAAATQNPDILAAVEHARLEIAGPVDLMHVQWIKDSSYHGHQIVLRAIREVRPDDAKDAMWNHIDTARIELEAELGMGEGSQRV